MPVPFESFDVVIATYNRPQKVVALVEQVNACLVTPIKIIIVDSSDHDNEEVQNLPKVFYIHSSHKNQPYQRLLGAKISNSKYIVYLDDDLIITDNQIFNYILTQYQTRSVVGVTVGIDYHNSVLSQLDTPILKSSGLLVKWFWKFTGVPFPASGEIGRFGVPGSVPIHEGQIMYFYGPVMSFKNELVGLLIDDDLMSLYEKRLGKGEDKIISMKANLHGKLIIDPRVCLSHPAVVSTYFENIFAYYRRSIYSRLYLNKIYCEVFDKFKYYANLDFYWFAYWRLFIALFSFLLSFSKAKRKKIKGIISGISLAIRYPQKAKVITPEIDWSREIQYDYKQLDVTVRD